MASPNPLRRGCRDCGAVPFEPCYEWMDGRSLSDPEKKVKKFLSDCHESRKEPSREAQKNSHMTVHHRVHLHPSVKP